jgi:hypothetical protein
MTLTLNAPIRTQVRTIDGVSIRRRGFGIHLELERRSS